MIPKEEYVKIKIGGTEGVAFMYLGLDEEVKKMTKLLTLQKTCFEELRLKKVNM